MAIYHARLGTLRIYDSKEVLSDAVTGTVDIDEYDDSGPTLTDETADAASAAGSTFTFWDAVDAADGLMISSTRPFARITFDLTQMAVAAGALLATYWNGSSWASLTVTDGTAVSGNTMAQDGDIYFDIPGDWAIGATLAGVTPPATSYSLMLKATAAPSTVPIAEQGYPIDSQYFEVPFINMDFKCPEGRPRPEETLELNRENIDSDMHYTVQSERAITEGLAVSFTAKLDDTTNRQALRDALEVGTPGSTYWTAAGTSTKTDTSYIDVDGNSTSTPAFDDTSKKTCCIQVLWDAPSGTATSRIGRSCNEVYFDPSQIEIAEAEDGVTLTCNGMSYGAIDEITQFAYKY
jgi:hypothetical protein